MSCSCRHLERLKSARVEMDEASSVYMDYNAACPPDHRVLAEYQNRSLNAWGNISSPHLAGQKAQDLMESCRKHWTRLWGEREYIFCRGATEALEILLADALQAPGLLITTACAHPGVLSLMECHSRRLGIPLICLPVNRQGEMDLPALDQALSRNPAEPDGPRPLLVYSPVNHETGALQNCREISRVCSTRAEIFLDAPQAAARMPETEWMDFCSGFSLSGQKFYGLKGSGLLALSPSLALNPSRPDRFGTPDPAAAAALALAAELYRREKDELLSLQRVLQKEGIEILGNGDFSLELLSPEKGAPGVLCLALPDLMHPSMKEVSMEDLFYHLNREGIFLSRFSACSGTVNGSSRILEAMGFPHEYSSASLRISLGRSSRRDDFFRLRRSLDRFFQENRIQ